MGTEITPLAGSKLTVAIGTTVAVSFLTSSNVSPPPQPAKAAVTESESSIFFILVTPNIFYFYSVFNQCIKLKQCNQIINETLDQLNLT